MSSEAVPLLLATLFTVGCMVIHGAERHTERVTEVLGVLFAAAAAFTLLAMITHASGASDVLVSGFQEQLKLSDRVPADLE